MKAAPPGKPIPLRGELLHAPFFAMARRYPDRPALVWARGVATYRELAARIVSARSHLQQAGVRPGDRVAVAVERSADAVVVIYASLSLGAAYVPFDPGWPRQRQEALLDHVGARVVVTGADQPLPRPRPSGRFTTTELARTPCADDGLPPEPVTPDRLAYILCTGGSTGPPKSVCVSHRAARYFVDWACTELALSCRDRVAGVSSFCCDPAVFDLFAPLAVGAALHLYDDRRVGLSRKLAAFLGRHAISVLYTVPTTLSLLAARGALERQDLSRLRAVMFGGECFPEAGFTRLRAALPRQVVYYNLYGPTETNVCTCYRVYPHEAVSPGIPIGRPLPGTQIFTLPVDGGCAGDVELCVHGPSLMDGYWRDERDKAPHWWQDPVSGRRCYRTGDIGRRDPQRDWLYIGRCDPATRSAGLWPGAHGAENVMLEEAGVSQCAGVAAGSPEAPGLVMFLVLREGCRLEDLRRRLAAACVAQLPEEQQPRDYVAVGELPTHPSGKVDRAALAALYELCVRAGTRLVPARRVT
ncbi:AMP-binding protein [Aquabacterium sp. A7-Y]|uniref:AMP-binding protein n=1 Tax=Aquabacterium sp. A7-Y TaxID=1349605 RepID=UPI00223D6F74|nr:AMP-binding protein [Aquabacterium sp. A7-Y]MCW7539420.1 AMP-binding protein [Aquabacterium sp. A7-Y]